MAFCRCGCGQPVKGKRVFVNKEHHLQWMVAGGASQMNALQPLEAKQLGGHVAGTSAVENGRLAEAAKKGAARSREIAERFHNSRASGVTSESGDTPDHNLGSK